MFLPKLLPRLTRRDNERQRNPRHSVRQFDLPGQFPEPGEGEDQQTTARAITTQRRDDDGERTTTRTTVQPGTTQRDATSATSATTVAPGTTSTTRAAVSGIATATSHSSSSTTPRRVSTTTSQPLEVVTTEIVVLPTQAREPIDFPIPTQPTAASSRPGRGYAFIKSSEIADAMLLFAVFCGACFVFTFLLIKLTRLSERRRGVAKEDQMLGEDMRWAEGREVIEKRIVWRGHPDHAAREPGGPAGERKLPGSKLARRQSWGDRKR